jgi:hypothetical protein
MKYIDLSSTVEQSVERSWSAKEGWDTVRRFKGKEDDIKALEGQMQWEGYSTSIRSGPVWELTAKIAANTESGGGGGPPDTEEPVETWELTSNAIEKDLLASDDENAALFTDYELACLRRALNGETVKSVDGTIPQEWTIGGDSFTPINATADVYLRLIISGVKSKPVYQPVIRLTLTFNDNYNIPLSLTNVGCVVSTAYMTGTEGVPTEIGQFMPASETLTWADGLNRYNGWLKVYPTISVAAGGKKQLNQEWHYGFWSEDLFTVIP